MKPIVTWVLVADGAEARIYENDGPGKGLHAVEGMHFSQAHLHTRDIMADKPGRSFASASHGRSAMEYSSNPVDVRERKFVTHLAAVLDEHLRKGDFNRLIIAAAPSALGDIRPALGKELSLAVIAELPKDLTKIPPHDLVGHFEDLLAV